jgi:uncharacterized protein (TIGR00730 family)
MLPEVRNDPTIRRMRIGITLTSALDVGQEYIDLTERVAKYLAEHEYGVVYGGTDYGMMAKLGVAYKAADGNDLVGVMAKDLMKVTKNYVAFDGLDTSFLEETMEDRKHRILEQSDAFVILPGGYGTFEELGSIIGGKVNKLYDKPIALYNFNHFYDTLIDFLEEMQSKAFSKVPLTEFVLVSDNLEEIMSYIDSYRGQELADKFVA